VRVVGSEEARDARALRVCDKSHDKDPQEAARCKANYRANRQHAAQHGLVPDSAAQHEAPTPKMMQKVRAITAAAVETDRAASAASAPAAPEAALSDPQAGATAPEAEDAFNPLSIVRGLSPILLIVATFLVIKRQRGKG
jgi:hypothetical protein